MALELVEGYGWVTLVLMVNLILNQWMGIQVGKARRKYKVYYPTMYVADSSDNKDGKIFNCIQRGHQNFLEFMPALIASLLVGGLQYPRLAATFGAIYAVARVLYFKGYSTGDAKARYAYGGGIHFLALFGLFGCTIGFTLHQFWPDYV